MTDDRDYDEHDTDQPQGQDRNWRELRTKAEEYEKRARAAERELAFAKAGISLDDPKLAYFRKGYDGDLDPHAIKAAAIEAGFLKDDSEPDPSEIDAHRRLADASAGAEPATEIALEDALNAAKSPEEVMAIASAAGLPTVNDTA